MTRRADQPSDDTTRLLTTETAPGLLELGLQQPRRPIDNLIDRLAESDGQTWLHQSTRNVLTGEQIHEIETGMQSIDGLIELKNQCKTRVTEAATHDDALAGLAVYCLTVAAAAVHHDALISSRSGEEWSELLTDIADAAPPRWRELFDHAATSVLAMEPRDRP